MKNIFNLILMILFSSVLAYFTSYNNIVVTLQGYEIPLIFLCMAIIFIIHWLAFIPAFLLKTERFYDLVGAIANISVLTIAFYYKSSFTHLSDFDYRAAILYLLVVIWAARLGLFLFVRILKDGKDRRFDNIKNSFLKFLVAWTLSGLWVFTTTLCALTSICTSTIKTFFKKPYIPQI